MDQFGLFIGKEIPQEWFNYSLLWSFHSYKEKKEDSAGFIFPKKSTTI